jgi:hypothetical protein
MMHSPQVVPAAAAQDLLMSKSDVGPAPQPIRPAERMARPKAIEILRDRLTSLCDEEHCACEVAAHLGVFCQGFRNQSDRQLRQRFDWIASKRPKASRAEIERLVSLYHVGRQEVTGAVLCCDVETREHCACDGWNMFDNHQLETFCSELADRSVRIE